MTTTVAPPGGRYKWVALSNTTLGVLMSALDGSIMIISLPAIFRGIGLDPLAPGNIGYLLWMILGYLLVSAVLVVTLGRLGDMFGRVRMYNTGFVIFSAASVALSFDPFHAGAGALWLIGWRIVQAVGGSMLTANSAAILTDAFPREQRGMALGVNQIAALAGQFLGLVVGGLLAEIDWRAVFWVSVPFGLFGTVWSIRSLREVRAPRRARIDWGGNITFAAGTASLLAAITYGIQPHGGAPTGWGNPVVLGGLAAGVLLLVAFCVIETRVADPMFDLSLFRIRAFSAGNLAALLTAMARGGLQFMLIIWLQGIWLPLHGYDFESTPLWAGIFMLPLTAGFLIAGPAAGYLSDRFGARLLSTGGLLLVTASFLGLLALPVDFSYPVFAGLLVLSGIGQGVFSAPNTSAIMSSVPENQRGVASGMRSTFQNSGTALSIGVFFSLMVAGLARSLPDTLTAGLQERGVPAATAESVANLPPVSTLFAAFLGSNPVEHLLGPDVLAGLAPTDAAALTGTEFFPRLITEPFHHGLVTVFTAAAAMALVAALASASRGRRYFHQEPGASGDAGRAPTAGRRRADSPPARGGFIIFITAVGPLTLLVMGTTIGTRSVLFPMSVMATFVIGRIVEQNLVSVDPGVVEAARAMGASRFRIVWSVLVPEALGPLILGYTFIFIAVVDMSAMAGYVGGGGLGNFAITYGYQQFDWPVTLVTVVIIIVIVQAAQLLGNRLARIALRR